MAKRKNGERQEGAYLINGETWRYAYYWWPQDSGHHFTTVYLRKDKDGPGRNTHTAHVNRPPDMFFPFELETTPLHGDPNPSVQFP